MEILIPKDESFFWKFMFSLYSGNQTNYKDILKTISSDDFNFNYFCRSINQISFNRDDVEIVINRKSFQLLEVVLRCQNKN